MNCEPQFGRLMKETSRSLVIFSTLYVYVFAVSGIVIMDVSVASKQFN